MSQVKDSERASQPSATPEGKRRDHKKLMWVSIISGLVGFLLFLSVPFLPVKQTEASYSWPQNDQLTSVTSPLMSYMAQDIDVSIPVSALQDINDGEQTILSTVPEDAKDATLRGMFVRSINDGVDVIVRNVVPLSITADELRDLPENATLRITSDHEQTRVWVPGGEREDGSPLDGSIADDIRPMLTGIYSEIQDSPEAQSAADAGDLSATVTVDSRFSSSPTVLKSLAILVGLVLTAISLWTLHGTDKLDGRVRSSKRKSGLLHKGFWKPRPLDAVVGFVLLAWYFVGANTADDGYLRTMGQVAQNSGYMANYYRWFGVTESPFGWPFYDLLGLMTKISTTSVVMRIPSLIAGIVVWLVLSREVLPRLGTRINQRKVAHITMAATFLLFWMTYNNGTRPEPIIAMFALLSWVSFERAIATHRLLPAAVGTILATLALGAGPTGLMAVAALLASLGSLIRIMIRRLPLLGAPTGSPRGASVMALLAQIAPFLAAGTAILCAVFGDQTFASVTEAIRVRSAIGPSVPWYEEYIRYTTMLEPTVDGSFPRRFTMLMLLFSFGVVIATMLRFRRVPGAAVGPTTRLLLVFAGTMFFMVFTPTKWTHHFGAFAGIGAAVAALAAVAASRIAVSSQRNRIIFFGSTLMLFALCLAGPNGWWYIASYGVPWWDKSIQFKGIEASTVMLVLSLVVLVWGVVVGFLADAKRARATTDAEVKNVDDAEARRLQRFRGIATAPIAVLTSLVVVFSLASLGKGMLSQWPAYSIGKGNTMSLAGNTCSLASDVLVETNTNESFLKVADGSELKDSLIAGRTAGFDANNVPTRIDADGDTESSSGGSSSQEQSAGSRGSTSTGTGSTDGAGSQGAGASGSGTGSEETTETNSSTDTGTTGGVTGEAGINGSYAKLPFGLDNKRVPVIGSYTQGVQQPSYATTKWFELPDRANPLVVFSAAGSIFHHDMNGVQQYGQEVKVEYGRMKTDEEMAQNTDDARAEATSEEQPDEAADAGKDASQDRFMYLGEMEPLDIGTQPEWRNMRVPMDQIPEEATVMRIRAVDTNLTPDQWIAFTPPRAPEMMSMQDYVGNTDPTLLDWSVAFQFPCLRPYDHYAGVAETPKWRISPDHEARRAHTPVMDYYGGGSVGMVQMTTEASEVPTYLNNDWQRDWGVLDRLETHRNGAGEAPEEVTLDTREVTRSGLYSPGPMKYNQS